MAITKGHQVSQKFAPHNSTKSLKSKPKMSPKLLLVLLIGAVLLTTHSLANHHKTPPNGFREEKPPIAHRPAGSLSPPHRPHSSKEPNLDGKPPKGSKPRPKHKPPPSN